MAHEVTGSPDRTGAERQKRRVPSESLSSDMRTLTGVIKDLEAQLDRMIAANEALKGDLDQERSRRLAAQSKLDQVSERLTRAEQELAGKENLHGEVSQLNHERARLAASLRDLGQKLEQVERENKRQSQTVVRLRAARSDAVEEIQSVESQFERAMQMVAQLKSQLAAVSEERDALAAESALREEKLRHAQHERNELQAEVEQSRAALDEIRRSLVDAVVPNDSGSRPGAREKA